MTDLSIAERVERGIALLDESTPDWRALVNENVNMRNKFNCILGQVFGHYDTGLRELDMDWQTARAYGFDALRHDSFDYEAMRRDYDALEDEWARRLTEDA